MSAFHFSNPTYDEDAANDDLSSLVPVPQALELLLAKVPSPAISRNLARSAVAAAHRSISARHHAPRTLPASPRHPTPMTKITSPKKASRLASGAHHARAQERRVAARQQV